MIRSGTGVLRQEQLTQWNKSPLKLKRIEKASIFALDIVTLASISLVIVCAERLSNIVFQTVL